MQITPTVKQLLIINILFFIGSQLVPSAEAYFALYSYQSSNFHFWQLITHMFMHGNLMHIFFNMFALYSFGSILEEFWGPKKFIFFYISCGLGAALMQMAINYFELHQLLEGAANLSLSEPTLSKVLNATISQGNMYRPDLFETEVRNILQNAGKLELLNKENFVALYQSAQATQVPMVGASGAIYGLLVAFAFMVPDAKLGLMFIPIPIKAKYFVPGLLLVDLFLGIKGNSIFGGGSGVAHFAHIGGAIVGFLMMWYWKKNSFNNNRWN